MSQKKIFTYLLALSALASCQPEPIDINIPERPETLTVSSVAVNRHSVVVAAAYSANSLLNLESETDSSRQREILNRMLVDSATVTITAEGRSPVTLARLSAGIYGSTSLNLEEGVKYILTVVDSKKAIAVTSSTYFTPQPQIDYLYPEIIVRGTDTSVKLHIGIKGARNTDYYFMSYTTSRGIRSDWGFDADFANLDAFEPKRLELFGGENSTGDIIERNYTLPVLPTDTLAITIGKIDAGYYNFLSAYKRTGYLINQLTGEPINLPTNVNNGFGYFSLFTPARRIFHLPEW